MTAISGSAAAVTGAASGIGRALALELAARGCDLALADRDEAGLQQVAAEIGKDAGRKVSTHRVDVGEPAQIQEFARAAIAAHPGLNIVINNAGVALLGGFNEVDQAQMEWLININFWGVVHGTRAFLPHLSHKPEAHIVNLSSIFGIIAPPGQTAYCAAKFAVRGFSESLRHELAMANSPVKLSVVHPGGVLTNIVRNSRTGAGDHRQCAPRGIDRPLRCDRQDHAAGRSPAHHHRHREEPAAHSDRQRRAASWICCSGFGRRRIGRCWRSGSGRLGRRKGNERWTLPSPLVGEGGSLTRSGSETDEGSVSADGDPSSGASRHLLPQGEKEEQPPISKLQRPTSLSAKYPMVLR